MTDIIENEEIDKDIITPDELKQQFNKKYVLLTEKAVSLKKSYINKLHATKSLRLAVSLSDNNIEVYDFNKTTLTPVCRLSGHQKGLTEIVFSPNEEHLLYSAGQDACIKLWDIRAGDSCVQQYCDEDKTIRPYECMDVCATGQVLCAGTQFVKHDAYIVFWDRRTPRPLGGYMESHTNDLTQVQFHKEKREILATGALDGLVNIFNTLESNEDDALIYSFNIENSVERLSWLDGERVACFTQSNDLQIWDTSAGDLTETYCREKVAKSIRRSRADDCYLVDMYMSIEGAPVLLAGSSGDKGDVLRSVTMSGNKLSPRTLYKGNKQIVRCCWYDKERDLLVTTGESGFMSVWKGSEGAEDQPTASKAATSNKLHANRHKPY